MDTHKITLPDIPPSHALLNAVRGKFITHGSSLNKWCIANKVDRVWASDALIGKRNGPKAIRLRRRILAIVEML